MIVRRSLLKGGGVLALSGLCGQLVPAVAEEGIQAPVFAGRRYPKIRVPENACDCHHHIYDPVRFAYVPEDVRNQSPAGVDAYRLLQKRLGTTRSVIVQPSAYGFDNACTPDALKQMGASARAVVVVNESISDGELDAMHALGVRGIRFNIATGASKDRDPIKESAAARACVRLARAVLDERRRYRGDGELHPAASQPDRLDHRGHIPQPEGTAHPAFKVICGLLEKGQAWVKLSGLYQDTKVGEPGYADTVKVGKAFVDAAPERMLWDRLAPPVDLLRAQALARRREHARPARRAGPRRNRPPPDSRREPRNAVRLRSIEAAPRHVLYRSFKNHSPGAS